MLVRDIMSPEVVTVGMDDTLETMQAIFEQFRFHHLVVVSQETRRVMGIISDRDLLKYLSPYLNTANELPRDSATLKKRAHQIMTRKPVTVSAGQTVQDAILILNDQNVSCLPVIDDENALVGILSWRSVMQVFAERIRQ